MHITTIGLDLAKHWFQIYGIDAAGKVVVRRRLHRTEVVEFFRRQGSCLVGMEACATALLSRTKGLGARADRAGA